MNADGQVISVVEDDQGEGMMDEVMEETVTPEHHDKPKPRFRKSPYQPNRQYRDQAGKTLYVADANGSLHRLTPKLGKAERKRQKRQLVKVNA